MNEVLNIAVLVGSLRKASFTRKVADVMMAIAPPELRCQIVELGDLPLYNQDFDDSPAPSWTRFRTQIARAQAVLILTPEYNRSIPGCLKNALDIGSRPSGKNLWDGKPAAIVSVTPYKLGAFGANHAVRQALVFLNMPAMQQPEAYIGGAAELFDSTGAFVSDEVGQLLTGFLTSFSRWATKLLATDPREEFGAFMTRRKAIAAAYSNGDAAPLQAIVTQQAAATFFPPRGGFVTGSHEVAERYTEDAKSFQSGGKTHLEILDCGASGEMAFWTGFQDFDGSIAGHKVKMKLRITELFRLQDGEWKLIHRHADPATTAETTKAD